MLCCVRVNVFLCACCGGLSAMLSSIAADACGVLQNVQVIWRAYLLIILNHNILYL